MTTSIDTVRLRVTDPARFVPRPPQVIAVPLVPVDRGDVDEDPEDDGRRVRGASCRIAMGYLD
ncbi:hypothetical protein P3T37_000122 [Kitasatospora sp. MAA4]|uniref:hypothetical protein n=1 Tax=Kitasatospora sp. MAA4 TaxID=3035093 RepID=UPI002475440F|nr:hypothetical protein [Kitasatospora sp. MAA4]MDH6130755.1 hypothetical protein [Kitasatospora sp. MAA4]